MTIGNAATAGPGAPDSGYLSQPRWTDKSFPLGRARQGVAQKPDFDFVELGLLFPQNDPSEKIYILDQMWHTKKLDTNLRLHVHFLQNTVEIPNFVCEYRYYNNGDDVPAWTTVETDNGAGAVFTYSGTPFVNLIRFPELQPPSTENISAILDLIIYRDDNRVAGDVLTKYVDYHFQVDANGSKQEFVK